MISIITPAYKVDKYIERCIRSVQNQRYQDYEHIIIIQECLDRTEDICKEYASKDKKIRLFYTEKDSNLSINRNIGIKNSRGEYIALLDGDDEYEPCFLYDLYEEALKTEADIVVGRCRRKNKEWMSSPCFYENSGLTVITDSFLLKEDVPPLWMCLYKKCLFKNVLFDENLSIIEDWLFLKEMFFYSKTMSYVNSAYYLYWDNDSESLMNDRKFTYNKHLLISHSLIYSHLKFYNMLLEKNIKATNFIIISFNTLFRYFYFAYRFYKLFDRNVFKKEAALLKNYLRIVPFKKRILYRFGIACPKILFCMIHIYKIITRNDN